MFASFFCNGILFGTINSSGIIFDVLKKDLEEQGVVNPASKACKSIQVNLSELIQNVFAVITLRTHLII